MVLLTKEPMHLESGRRLKPPELHILALVEKVETSHERKGEKVVTAHVNLLSGASGTIIPYLAIFLIGCTRASDICSCAKFT